MMCIYSARARHSILLWVLAALEEPAYAPMIVCFSMFLVNDLYGFISWKAREVRQRGADTPGAAARD